MAIMTTSSLYHPRYWPTWIGLFALRLLALLPVRWQYGLAKWIGLGVYRFSKRRAIVETNIRLCFPELNAQQQQQLVQENFIASAYGIIEIILSFWPKKQFFAQYSEMHGIDKLEQAQQQGQGVLLLGLHVTSLEISGHTLTDKIRPVGTTYKTQGNRVFNAYLLKKRQKILHPVLEKQQMRSLIKSLSQGQIIWFAPDQDFGAKGSVFAPFFAIPAATSDNLGKIVKLTKAKVLFFNHYRCFKNGKPYFIGEILDPFHDSFNDDAVHNATLLNQAIEQAVRRHPEQYLWAQKRFRTRPAGEAKLYKKGKKTHG